MNFLTKFIFCSVCVFIFTDCSQPVSYDLVIRNATIYDGSGDAPVVGDLAVNADTIAGLRDLLETWK